MSGTSQRGRPHGSALETRQLTRNTDPTSHCASAIIPGEAADLHPIGIPRSCYNIDVVTCLVGLMRPVFDKTCIHDSTEGFSPIILLCVTIGVSEG